MLIQRCTAAVPLNPHPAILNTMIYLERTFANYWIKQCAFAFCLIKFLSTVLFHILALCACIWQSAEQNLEVSTAPFTAFSSLHYLMVEFWVCHCCGAGQMCLLSMSMGVYNIKYSWLPVFMASLLCYMLDLYRIPATSLGPQPTVIQCTSLMLNLHSKVFFHVIS